MADIYVRSTDGSNTDNGSTWALAKLDLAGAAAIDAAGDVINVSGAHAESTATAISLAFAGTPASPTKVLCVDDAAEPPTTSATTATVTTTGNSKITINGNVVVDGISFNMGSGSNSLRLEQSSNSSVETQVYRDCKFKVNSTGSGTTGFLLGSGTVYSKKITWENCAVSFGHTGNIISVGCAFAWEGGEILSGSSQVTTLVSLSSGISAPVRINGVNLSNLSSSLNLFDGTASRALTHVVSDCRVPAGWTGGLWNSRPTYPGPRVEMYNCDGGDTYYIDGASDYSGDLATETTLVRTGGFTENGQSKSHKMTTTANASDVYPFVGIPLAINNDATGSAKTVTVEILHDSATNLTDKDVWVEVIALDTASYCKGSWYDDANANILLPSATATDQASSSETWTTTGMSNPNKQKLSVTLTPQQKGPMVARVVLAAASKTIYVCPKLTVT